MSDAFQILGVDELDFNSDLFLVLFGFFEINYCKLIDPKTDVLDT